MLKEWEKKQGQEQIDEGRHPSDRSGEVNRGSYFFFVEVLTTKTDVDEFAT